MTTVNAIPAPMKLQGWDDPAVLTAIDAAVPARAKGDLSRASLREQLKITAGDFGYPVLLYPGDTVAEALTVGEWPVVVAGSLTVGGVLEDCDGCDNSLLIVLGDLRAGSILTLSEIRVAGGVSAAAVIYGNSMGNHTLTAKGVIRGKCVIEDGHHFEAGGGVESEVAEPAGGWPERLVQAVLTDEGDGIHLPAFLARARAGKPILRRK